MQFNIDLSTWTKNKKLISWIEKQIELCKPDGVHLCTGSKEEYDDLIQMLVKQKMAIALNPDKRPNSYLFRSSPEDVARVEESTFICSKKKKDAGPTNNWKDPKEMKKISKSDVEKLLKVDSALWLQDAEKLNTYFAQFENLPSEIQDQIDSLKQRLTKENKLCE